MHNAAYIFLQWQILFPVETTNSNSGFAQLCCDCQEEDSPPKIVFHRRSSSTKGRLPHLGWSYICENSQDIKSQSPTLLGSGLKIVWQNETKCPKPHIGAASHHKNWKESKLLLYISLDKNFRIVGLNYHIRYKIMCCTYHMYHHDRGLCYQLCIQYSGSAVLLINFPPI